MLHVAILKPNYIRDILAGTKTVESRLTKTNQPPHGRVQPGERLFLKASGGPFMATALAAEVLSWDNLSPAEVRRIEKQHRRTIGGDDAYWQAKRDSRFATLIRLTAAEPLDVGPAYKVAYMKAWYVLDEALSPLREVVLTDGAIRNRYATLPGPQGKPPPTAPITLELPSGEAVVTDLVRGRMLRWRGWATVYDAADAQPGDRLRFLRVDDDRYRVSVRKPDART
jgi:hypothetical protein